MIVSVIGLGYIGLPTAALIASKEITETIITTIPLTL
jgi:UDP-N-acetyl-D-mannosaminuronate dehydrogenase